MIRNGFLIGIGIILAIFVIYKVLPFIGEMISDGVENASIKRKEKKKEREKQKKEYETKRIAEVGKEQYEKEEKKKTEIKDKTKEIGKFILFLAAIICVMWILSLFE